MRLVGRGWRTVVCWQVGISGPHWSATASGQTSGVPVKTVTGSEVIRRLEALPDWHRADGDKPSITATFEFDYFSTALAFVNEVGQDAEHLNHHPDIHILWNKVILVQSHPIRRRADSGRLRDRPTDLPPTRALEARQ